MISYELSKIPRHLVSEIHRENKTMISRDNNIDLFPRSMYIHVYSIEAATQSDPDSHLHQ